MPLSSIPLSPTNQNNAVRSLRILKQTKIVPLPTASPDEQCCICLQLYGPTHRAVTVLIKDCYHRFGKDCLNKFLDSNSSTNNICPQCRSVWYTRPPARSPRDINTTRALAPFSIPRALTRIDSRAATHRTLYDLEHHQNTNNSVISSHFDEVFRRLDSIQDVSSERSISGADARVRLEAIERRARRINEDLQPPLEVTNGPGIPSRSLRDHEVRTRLQSTQEENTARRRWLEAFAVELDDDPYSLMSGANRSIASLPRSVFLLEEPQVITERSVNGALNMHPAFRPSPPGESSEPERTAQDQLQRSNNLISSSPLTPLDTPEFPVLSRIASDFPSNLASTSCGPSVQMDVTTADVASAPASLPGSATERPSEINNPSLVGPTSSSLATIPRPSLRPWELHSNTEASPQLLVRDHTSPKNMRRRAWNTFQTTLAGVPSSPRIESFQASLPTQAATNISATPIPTPTLTPSTRQIRRHPSLRNLFDPPRLSSPPTIPSWPPVSNRPRRRASNKEASQSKEKPHWLRKLSRVSSLSSLREAVFPGHRHVQNARVPQWPAAGRSSVANEVFRSDYWADPR